MRDLPKLNARSNVSHLKWYGQYVTGVLCSLLVACCMGCGSSNDRGYIVHEEDLYPVSGQVLFEGKPASNASVVLHRTEQSPLVESDTGEMVPALNPRGTCDKTGKFQLYTYAAGDGAPAGDFFVTVSWQDPENRGRDENYPELLPKRYLLPATSGLKAHVISGENVLPTFELKR